MVAKGLSSHTVDGYLQDVILFKQFFGDRIIGEVSRENIYSFISHLRHALKESPKSVQRRTSALKNFFHYLYGQGAISSNPAETVPCGKVMPPLPVILSEIETRALLETARKSAYDFLLVSLLVEVGLKTNEILAVKTTDFDLSNQFRPEIRIHCSNPMRSRGVVISQECANAYTMHISSHNAEGVIFSISERDLHRRLKELAGRAGIKKDIGCQILRDTSAVRRLQAGDEIGRVMKRLGIALSKDIMTKYLKLAEKAI
jgi:integrase/recombinase XerD